ncbi:MAG: ATP-binding protein, partial [Phycisphaerae bacterium]|nr:ATP-binding protein [Phycisphaerae bacterium]
MGRFRQELLAKIERYGLDKDDHWQDVKFEAEQNMLSEGMCELLLFDMEPDIQRQIDFPDYIHRSPDESTQLYERGQPDVCLGTLLDNPDISFGVCFDRPLHVIAAGLTGFGKTTCLRVLQKGIHEFGKAHPDRKKSIITFDRKGNDYGDFKDLYGFRVFDVHTSLRLSLESPIGMPPNIWINILATLFCARAGLKASWATVVMLLRWLLALLNPHPANRLIWPTFGLLLDVLNASKDTLWSSKGDYSRSVRQQIEAIVLASGTTFDASQGFLTERDIIAKGHNVILSMPNMDPSWARQFFTDIILARTLYGRAHRSHRVDATEVFFVIDEADSDISAEAEGMFPDRMCPVSRCFKQGREFGISVCVGITDLRSASRFVLSNATDYFIFRMNDAESIYQASRTLMLPPNGELRIGSLAPGECLLKQVGPWPHTMAGKIDYMPPCRSLPKRYDTHPFVSGKHLSELPEVKKTLAKLSAEKKNQKERTAKPTRPGLSDIALQLLKICYENPFTPVVRLFEKMGAVPFSAQKRIREEIEKQQLAVFEELRVGSKNLLIMELQPKTCELLGKDYSRP